MRRHIPAPTLSLGMQSHFPTLMAAMVCSVVAHGDAWANARLLVDLGSEHPLLISQTIGADSADDAHHLAHNPLAGGLQDLFGSQ